MRRRLSILAAFTILGTGAVARAQMAVIDVDAIARLMQQVATMQQQLETARSQLGQAQAQFQSTTGGRGMEQLLAGTVRNYLPADWTSLNQALSRSDADFGAFSRAIASRIAANAVLTPRQLAALSPSERDELQAARQTAALLQVTTQQALANTSRRFDSLQQLINAIGQAQDQKAVLDLQARISVEQAMLQNEQTKLQVLFQVAQAQERARRLRSREQALTDIGSVRNLPPVGLIH